MVKKIFIAGCVVVLLLVGTVVGVRFSVRDDEKTVESVGRAPVAIVLGAGLHSDGTPTSFLSARLNTAKQLYDTGKVDVLLITGDNGQVNYNEVGAMRTWLVDHDVPDSRIVSDYAGFDTHDSCNRAKTIFGVDKAIVVTQEFHLSRALFSCKAAGIDALGVSASAGSADVRNNEIREWPATIKAAFDAAISRDPKFLGDRETSIDDILKSLPN